MRSGTDRRSGFRDRHARPAAVPPTRAGHRSCSSILSRPGDSIRSRRVTVLRFAVLNGRAMRGAGGRRSTGAGLPKMWVFLIRGRRVSRWKPSAEPETREATSEPRFPVLKARREVCPPTVPDNEPACCRPRLPPSAGGPGQRLPPPQFACGASPGRWVRPRAQTARTRPGKGLNGYERECPQ